jgi:hypothetical protein
MNMKGKRITIVYLVEDTKALERLTLGSKHDGLVVEAFCAGDATERCDEFRDALETIRDEWRSHSEPQRIARETLDKAEKAEIASARALRAG